MNIQKDLEGKPKEFDFGGGKPKSRKPKKPKIIPNEGHPDISWKLLGRQGGNL